MGARGHLTVVLRGLRLLHSGLGKAGLISGFGGKNVDGGGCESMNGVKEQEKND